MTKIENQPGNYDCDRRTAKVQTVHILATLSTLLDITPPPSGCKSTIGLGDSTILYSLNKNILTIHNIVMNSEN